MDHTAKAWFESCRGDTPVEQFFQSSGRTQRGCQKTTTGGSARGHLEHWKLILWQFPEELLAMPFFIWSIRILFWRHRSPRSTNKCQESTALKMLCYSVQVLQQRNRTASDLARDLTRIWERAEFNDFNDNNRIQELGMMLHWCIVTAYCCICPLNVDGSFKLPSFCRFPGGHSGAWTLFHWKGVASLITRCETDASRHGIWISESCINQTSCQSQIISTHLLKPY